MRLHNEWTALGDRWPELILIQQPLSWVMRRDLDCFANIQELSRVRTGLGLKCFRWPSLIQGEPIGRRCLEFANKQIDFAFRTWQFGSWFKRERICSPRFWSVPRNSAIVFRATIFCRSSRIRRGWPWSPFPCVARSLIAFNCPRLCSTRRFFASKKSCQKSTKSVFSFVRQQIGVEVAAN